MASLSDIRSRINSVENTQQVTRAMKMVAAAKLRKAQERIFRTRPYAYQLREIISHLKGQLDPASHELFLQREETESVLMIVITADRGLCGAFNANAIKAAVEAINDRYAEQQRRGDLGLLTVGRNGSDHFGKRDYRIAGTLRGLFDDLSFEHAKEIADTAKKGFLEGAWDEVVLVYNEFKNTISQNQVVEPLLPIPAESFLTPVMQDEIEHQAAIEAGRAVDYIFEPNARAILDELVPRFVNYQVWRALLESNAAEQGARMVAMDNATSNAGELLEELQLKYNRARQDAITTEIIEITSGAEALAQQG